MARQFQVQVQGQEVAFPSSLVRIVQSMDASFIEYLGTNYPTEETVQTLIDLANIDGTEQVLATIVRVNDGVQTNPLQMGFPASLINIYPSTLSGANSVIVYNNDFYYAEETESDLVTAANQGGGGGGVTIYTGDGSLSGSRTIDVDGHDFLIKNGVVGSLLSISQTDAQTLITQNQGSSSATFDFEGSTVNPHMNVEVTDGTAHSFIDVSSATGSNVSFSLIAWESVGTGVQIVGNGVTKDIAYTADTHTFNVGMTITELAGVGTRAIAVDADGKIVLLV